MNIIWYFQNSNLIYRLAFNVDQNIFKYVLIFFRPTNNKYPEYSNEDIEASLSTLPILQKSMEELFKGLFERYYKREKKK